MAVKLVTNASTIEEPLPPVVKRQYSFTDFSQNNPTTPPLGNRMDAEYDRINVALNTLIKFCSAVKQLAPAFTDTKDVAGADLTSLEQDYAALTQAWAEYMPSTIPPNLLAVMNITGDHWSSRWWANQALQILQSRPLPAAGIVAPSNAALKGMTGTPGVRAARLGFSTSGDGGYAEYTWSAANCAAPDDGAQVQPAGGGCWIADFSGTQPTPLIWGAIGDGVRDDSVAFQAALTAMSGRTLYQGPHSYYIGPAAGNSPYFPVGTTFKGSYTRASAPATSHAMRRGRGQPPRPSATAAPYGSYPALRVAGTVGFNMLPLSAVDGVLIYRAGMAFPAVDQSLFAGKLFNVAGDNVTIRNSMIMGFANAIYSDGFSRCTIDNMNFDNKANIYIANSTDTWQISHIHAWPFASDGPSMGAAAWTRDGPNFEITKSNDYTMVSHYLSWGYKKQFVSADNQGCTMLDCDADNSGVPGSHGFEMTGSTATSPNLTLIAPKAFGNDVGIFRNDAPSTAGLLKITEATIGGNQVAGIYLAGTNGITMLYNSEISANIAGILISTGASILDMDGNVMLGNGAPNPIVAQSNTDNVFIGPMNRFGLNSDTGIAATGPNVFAHAVNTSGTTLALPPVGSVFDLATVGGSLIDISGGWGGRQITLMFSGGMNVAPTAGGGPTKLQLRGNTGYLAPVGSTMTFIHSGNGSWIEVARQ